MKNKSKRKGFTLIELIFVLVIVTTLVIYGLSQYNKMKAPTQANGEFAKIAQLLGGIDRAAGEAHGSYPALTALAISGSDNAISIQMGGGSVITDIAGWTYNCAAGASSTITVTTSALTSTVLADLVRSKVRGAFPAWTPNANGNAQVVLTLSGVVCQ